MSTSAALDRTTVDSIPPAASACTAPKVANAAAVVESLVREFLPLAHHLVREMARRVPAHVNRDDLTSAALFALNAAARSFDSTLGVNFGSFASLRIRGALTDELRSLDWASRSVRSRSRALEHSRESLTRSLGRTPTGRELAASLGMTDGELASLQNDIHRATVVRSDALGPIGGSESVADSAAGPEAIVLKREEIGALATAIETLPERLRTVVEQYFFGQRLMADIARDLGVTESRISQLRSQALKMLREAMIESDADDLRTRQAS